MADHDLSNRFSKRRIAGRAMRRALGSQACTAPSCEMRQRADATLRWMSWGGKRKGRKRKKAYQVTALLCWPPPLSLSRQSLLCGVVVFRAAFQPMTYAKIDEQQNSRWRSALPVLGVGLKACTNGSKHLQACKPASLHARKWGP